MQQGNLTATAVWALRLALAGAMFTVDNPIRLAAAALILALQIPIHARLAAVARTRD